MINDSVSVPQAPESGVDLARQALAAARAAARQQGERPSGSRKAHRTRASRQPDCREPIGFQQLLANLITDRAWELPAAGGSLVDEWPAIATDLAGHVAVAGYDPATGELAVRPVSAPYATAVRLRTRQLIDAANRVTGSATAIRTIRILPHRATPAISPSAVEAAKTPPKPETAPDQLYRTPAGYQEAIAAHRQARMTRTTNPAIQTAVERQNREAVREPETLFADGQAEMTRLREQADRERTRSSSHALAVARARAEKAGLTPLPMPSGPQRLNLTA
ncbi:DUF721 domain-containing protein [Streptomyces sp. NPDC096339]|uniref:DUF721 domain-containing protein n=1 Tax=Streptomyces sp. NPDC096339 TaxID=3366086 RepID=UPI0038274AB0